MQIQNEGVSNNFEEDGGGEDPLGIGQAHFQCGGNGGSYGTLTRTEPPLQIEIVGIICSLHLGP